MVGVTQGSAHALQSPLSSLFWCGPAGRGIQVSGVHVENNNFEETVRAQSNVASVFNNYT